MSDQAPDWFQQNTQEAGPQPTSRQPTLRERSTETNIGQGQASTERTLTLTPIEAQRQTGQLRVEQATEGANIRRAEAQAESVELQNERLRRALEAGAGASNRLFGDELSAAENELQTIARNILEARRLSRDMFSASGFGYDFMREYWPGGSPAQTMAGLLNNIRSFTALNKLMELKSDPRNTTGGALGQVTERELEMLASSLGALDPSMGDEAFQQGLSDVLQQVLGTYNKIGGDPYALADVLRPEDVAEVAPMLRSWRALPEDEQTIVRYANESRANGTFDPAVYAQLTAEAYGRSTGRAPDNAFISNALAQAQDLQARPGAISGLGYDEPDAAVREQAVQRVYAQEPEGVDLSGTLEGAAINLIPSAFQMAGDTVQALTVDLPDTLEGIVDIIGGATGLSKDDAAWQATKDYFTTRYGTREGFADALRTDPAGILADVVGVATLGGTTAAKALGTTGRITRIAELADAARAAEGFTTLASRFDPLSIAAGMTRTGGSLTGRALQRIGAEVPARVVGAPSAAVEQAVSAGRRGSPQFTEQLTRAPNAPNIVDQLDTAVQELYSRRSLEYQNARNQLNLNETVPFTEIDRALLDTQSIGRYRDIDYRRAPEAWKAANDIVENFRSRGYNDVEAVDAMKQQLGGLRDSYPLGSAERGVVQDIYNGVRTAITNAAPEYAKMMEDYSAASDALADIRATLATNAASPDTTLRRLQQQVAGTGPRGRTVLDVIEGTQSGQGISDAIAGLALSADQPSGLTSSLAPTAAISGSPEALATLALTPRTVGRRAYGLGELLGGGERAVSAVANQPLFGGQSLADLTRRYAIPAAEPAATALRIVNPAAIQPMVNPAAPPQEELSPEVRRMILQEEPTVLPFSTDVGPAPASSGVSLDALAEQYGLRRTMPAAPGTSIEALAEQYSDGAAPLPAPAPATSYGTGPVLVTPSGRRVRFEPSTDEYVDVETGERAAEIEEFSRYKRGGRVKKPRGGPVHMPRPVVAARRPVPSRALKG